MLKMRLHRYNLPPPQLFKVSLWVTQMRLRSDRLRRWRVNNCRRNCWPGRRAMQIFDRNSKHWRRDTSSYKKHIFNWETKYERPRQAANPLLRHRPCPLRPWRSSNNVAKLYEKWKTSCTPFPVLPPRLSLTVFARHVINSWTNLACVRAISHLHHLTHVSTRWRGIVKPLLLVIAMKLYNGVVKSQLMNNIFNYPSSIDRVPVVEPLYADQSHNHQNAHNCRHQIISSQRRCNQCH